MSFEEIEGLSEKEIENLYDDILQIYDRKLSWTGFVCYCYAGELINSQCSYSQEHCEQWCRSEFGKSDAYWHEVTYYYGEMESCPPVEDYDDSELDF